MKNKKWISLAAAVILAVTALPMTAFAAEKDGGEEKLTKVTLNEVAHSIFYAPQYVAIEEGYFSEEGLDLTLITGFGADKVLSKMNYPPGQHGNSRKRKPPNTVFSFGRSKKQNTLMAYWRSNLETYSKKLHALKVLPVRCFFNC